MRVSKGPEQRRAELVTAARELFDQKGLHNTRVSDIVARVGVAQGVFYYYFASKKEMIAEVTRLVSREIQQKADAILQDATQPFGQRVAGFIRLYIDFVDQFLGDEETRVPENDDVSRPDTPAGICWGELNQKLLALVRQGVEQGALLLRYPEDQALVTLYGLWRLAADKLPHPRRIAVLVEQGMGLAQGSVAMHLKQPEA